MTRDLLVITTDLLQVGLTRLMLITRLPSPQFYYKCNRRFSANTLSTPPSTQFNAMGRLSSVLCDQALLIPRPTWTAKDIPDLTGQVIIVTGGNTGKFDFVVCFIRWTNHYFQALERLRPRSLFIPAIVETAYLIDHWQALLNHNATVYVTVRSQEKGDATVKEMKEVTGKEVKYLLMDLTDLKSVKAAAQDFQAYVWTLYLRD